MIDDSLLCANDLQRNGGIERELDVVGGHARDLGDAESLLSSRAGATPFMYITECADG